MKDGNKHLSVSLMAVLFVGGSLVTTSSQNDTNLATLFPPTPDNAAIILNGIKPYTPTITADTATVVSAYVDTTQHDYFDQLSILAVAPDNTLKDAGIVYSVQGGDTYSSIAQKFGLKTGSILATNGIDAQKLKSDANALSLQPGQQLNIPFEDVASPTEWQIVLQSIAQTHKQQQIVGPVAKPSTKNGKSVKVLASANGSRDTRSYQDFSPGYCTAYVAKLRPDIGAAVRSQGGGNAGRWGNAARAAGLRVDLSPQVGAAVVTRESAFGHVAVITGVTAGAVIVTEMNATAGWGRVDTREIPMSLVRAVIH